MLRLLILGRLRGEDPEFETSLNYIACSRPATSWMNPKNIKLS
jgi:hypothetical protein